MMNHIFILKFCWMKVEFPLEFHSGNYCIRLSAWSPVAHLGDVDNISTFETFTASAAEPQHFAPGDLPDPLPDGFHMLQLVICFASKMRPLLLPHFARRSSAAAQQQQQCRDLDAMCRD